MITVREMTSRAAGAVSVLCLAGEGALTAVAKLTGRAELKLGEVFVAELRAGDESLDEVLVLVRTRLLVELHLHGSPPLVRQIRELLLEQFGASLHDANSSLEAIAELRVATAPCAEGARILLDQAQGALRTALEQVCELDSDSGRRTLQELLQRGERAQFVLRPTVVVLAGPVNAGKSTLFNLLVGEDRALTSDLAGTTRDLVRARGQLGPWPVDWIDTAGERGLRGETREESVELEGQSLAKSVRTESDLCLWLAPSGGEAPPSMEGLRVCRIETFADLDVEASVAVERISVPVDPAEAVRIVRERFEAELGLEWPVWIPGAAVPFQQDQLHAIRLWIQLEAAQRGAAIREWLASH